MGKSLPAPFAALAHTVMELADSFGVFASLFCLERHTKKTLWEGGRLLKRTTQVRHMAAVTVIAERGCVGHARTERLTRPAVEQAFHAARRDAIADPGAARLIHTFSRFEQAAPPLLTASDDNGWRVPPLERAAEARHLQMAGQLAGRVQTLLAVSRDRLAAARSDGTSHCTAIWRARCDVGWRQPEPDGAPLHWCGGTSGFSRDALTPEAVFNGLSERLEPDPDSGRLQLPPKGGSVISPGACLLDAAILARIAHAWLFLPGLRDRRYPRVSALVEQLEGTPGYTPLHPFGYLWAPVAAASADDAGRTMGDALLSLPPGIGGHLSLTLPALDASVRDRHGQSASARTLLAASGIASGEEWIVMEGVRHFWLDEPSASFMLMPVRLYRLAERAVTPLPPAWWCGLVSGVLAGCIGSLGPERVVWASPAAGWTATAPAYAAVRPGRG